jgi:hypothetical protein
MSQHGLRLGAIIHPRFPPDRDEPVTRDDDRERNNEVSSSASTQRVELLGRTIQTDIEAQITELRYRI